jgi:hypothetical protein
MQVRYSTVTIRVKVAVSLPKVETQRQHGLFPQRAMPLDVRTVSQGCRPDSRQDTLRAMLDSTLTQANSLVSHLKTFHQALNCSLSSVPTMRIEPTQHDAFV